MRSAVPLQFFVISCLTYGFAIYYGIFNDLYEPSKHLNKEIILNYYLLLFFIGTCFYRIIDGWRLATIRKITQFDFFFLLVHNGLALIQLCSIFILYSGSFSSDTFFLKQALLLLDWSLLPLFAWIAVWSRHVRRGWNSRGNWIAVLLSVLSFFLCLVHSSSFYILLGIAVVVSCIALYETNKVHFYRHQVTPIVIALLILHLVFLFNRSLEIFSLASSSFWAYVYTISFTLITSLTNRLQLRILIDVNTLK